MTKGDKLYNQYLRNHKGKRLSVPKSSVNDVYRSQRRRRVQVTYIGPTKRTCVYCGMPFLCLSDGRGRYPEYHSNACKQKAYRQRKQRGGH